MRRIPFALLIVPAGLCALLAVMPALAPVAVGARYVAQGYNPPATATPGPSPTPTATPRPLILTPRPTSTGLPTPAPTATPYYISATPGPCTIALLSSAVCKTAWRNQVVTWTLPLGVFTRTSNIFDGTTRITTTTPLTPTRPITLTPRWQAARALTPITLTASGLTSTLWGQTLPNIVVTATRYMWNQARGWYTVTYYTRTADASGRFTVTIAGALLNSQRDYWTVSAHVTQTLHIGGVYTRRLYFPIVRGGS